MVNKEVEELELDVEQYRVKIEEKRSFMLFENAFFIPLFVILVLLSLMKTKTDMVYYMFLLAIALIIIDLIYSLVLYKRMNNKSRMLDAIIKAKMKKLHG
jgi:ABC-type multidrug transport system fused ATPase/permease subunit